ncbi:expressed protein [Chlorella variabilis]|uniref:Expressed protein n=1 Tax=Chlorella variabilis TaxID=554065 RepID=E1ZFW8_CHLVA|nr:expressed protein [Chlorella variabilis]EFN55361.1 expressed protein [Chlorella variabilis]|eukprot:XP_005847463.1 expressed protein [Chlorella variabilis]
MPAARGPRAPRLAAALGGGGSAAAAAAAVAAAGRSSLSAVFVLVAGALAEGAVFPWNLGRLGNAFTLWLGIDPPDLFFYAFLPPLLLHSALSIDYFLFNKAGAGPASGRYQPPHRFTLLIGRSSSRPGTAPAPASAAHNRKAVMMQVMVFAFLVVLLSTLLATPVLLYGLRLAGWGWRWQHGALFSAMLASTDALAITAVLRRAGGPESLITLMEGESLLNDASGK